MSRRAFRYRIWPVLGTLLIIAALLAPVHARSRLIWSAFWNGTHFIAFGALTLLAFSLFAGSGVSRARRLGFACGTTLALSVAVELIQPLFSRQGSVDDLVNGALGVLAAMFGLVVWRRGGGNALRGVHLASCVAVFAFVMWPAVLEWRASSWSESRFPLLADFEDARERPLWWKRGPAVHLAIVDRNPSSGASSLEVRVDAGARGGVGYGAEMQDWRPFGALEFDLYNPGEAFRLTFIAIDDGLSANVADRFTGQFEVAPGWNAFRIPIAEIRTGPRSRESNVGAVYRLLWSVRAESPDDLVFNLDHVRLIPD